jgi:hypothetical protein
MLAPKAWTNMFSSCLLVALLSMVAPSEEPTVRGDLPVFGQRGQLVLRGATSANVLGIHAQTSLNKVTLKSDQIGFSVAPSAGVFVIDNLLVGGLVNVSYAYVSHLYDVSAGVGPYLGYRVGMSPHTSFLPTLGAIYTYDRSHINAVDGENNVGKVDIDSHRIDLRLHADFVFHLAHRVSMTVGPFARQSVYNQSGGNKGPWITTYGINVGVLGWL